mmetsp:Transcript_5182/g.9500  ORF Transcript_5182/g.9500 Transcript_5182/m.9500 type:complete len:342 (-) Transcript_5182:24-1049(-)
MNFASTLVVTMSAPEQSTLIPSIMSRSKSGEGSASSMSIDSLFSALPHVRGGTRDHDGASIPSSPKSNRSMQLELDSAPSSRLASPSGWGRKCLPPASNSAVDSISSQAQSLDYSQETFGNQDMDCSVTEHVGFIPANPSGSPRAPQSSFPSYIVISESGRPPRRVCPPVNNPFEIDALYMTSHSPPMLESSSDFLNQQPQKLPVASHKHPDQQAESLATSLKTDASTLLRTYNVRFSPSAEHRVYISHRDICENDVLCGREERGTNHPGNVFYRDIIANNRPIYQMFRSKERKKKTNMSTSIIDITIKGRFIKQEDDSDFVYLLTRAEARKKVSQSLREK